MKEEILDFIQRRWLPDAKFLNGNCLWFAIILQTRFPALQIYYLPIEGHFVAGIDNEYYDWAGEKELEEEPILLDEIEKYDPLWFGRLMRDCFE